ncbi:bifunctional DNA primase/polymerase [Microbacterium cremeum]|uniref:bifunctional DNA primase/polymerase n=1 Tax=Microbacterium cremeum TaxID=2782169 RepID=UPI001888E99A|nr:bifunctional DNA primase/polymerase [Microbacterium cremeum]
MTTAGSNLGTALSLARAGFYVFPMTPSGKFLRGFSWDRGASRDREQIREWWASDPRQRIGVHCGRSGIVAVDVDRKHGKDGFKSLKAAGLELPRTFSYTSRSGQGEHHIYRAPAGEQLTIDRDLNGMPGVDVRSGIGMVAYNGPKLTKKPRLAPAPEWALVHKKDGWDYDMADLEAWLDAEGSSNDPTQEARAAKARRMATIFPEGGVDNGDLLYRITPLVSGLTWGDGRREAYEAARARYTNDYPDSKYLIAFDRAWAKAITRVEADGKKTTAGKVSHEVTAKSATQSGMRTLQLTPASAIKPRPVKWLWDGRIAIGTLALLAGREGIGKSTLAYWLVAQITRGKLPGESYGKPRAVLIAATEDSWAYTIVPRLIAARADLDMVFRVAVRSADEVYVGMNVIKDLKLLEQAAVQVEAGLLLLDPLMSRLGDQDTHKDSEVRVALEPIVDVADRVGMSVLGLIHHNKSGSTDPLQLIMGSKAFTAVARSVHTVVNDPDDEDEERKLFGTPKNNLGRTNLPTLSFTIAEAIVDTDEGPANTGRLVWGAEISESIGAVMERSGAENTDRTAIKEAADWLHDFLSMTGVVGSARVKEEGRKAGHSESALKRARRRIQAETRSEGFPRTTFWYLPGEEDGSSGAAAGPTPGESK